MNDGQNGVFRQIYGAGVPVQSTGADVNKTLYQTDRATGEVTILDRPGDLGRALDNANAHSRGVKKKTLMTHLEEGQNIYSREYVYYYEPTKVQEPKKLYVTNRETGKVVGKLSGPENTETWLKYCVSLSKRTNNTSPIWLSSQLRAGEVVETDEYVYDLRYEKPEEFQADLLDAAMDAGDVAVELPTQTGKTDGIHKAMAAGLFRDDSSRYEHPNTQEVRGEQEAIFEKLEDEKNRRFYKAYGGRSPTLTQVHGSMTGRISGADAAQSPEALREFGQRAEPEPLDSLTTEDKLKIIQWMQDSCEGKGLREDGDLSAGVNYDDIYMFVASECDFLRTVVRVFDISEEN